VRGPGGAGRERRSTSVVGAAVAARPRRGGPSAARRVQRGQALARRGAVEDLRIEPGRITGVVREDRVAPYRVELRWPVPDEARGTRRSRCWRPSCGSRAALLDGHLPEGIDEVLAAAGVPVLPAPADLEPTVHLPRTGPAVPARRRRVHTAAGALIDRDPFLLLALRGRGRDRAAAGAARRSGERTPTGRSSRGLDLSRGLFEAHGDLDAVPLHPAPVEDPAALFHRLGGPAGGRRRRAAGPHDRAGGGGRVAAGRRRGRRGRRRGAAARRAPGPARRHGRLAGRPRSAVTRPRSGPSSTGSSRPARSCGPGIRGPGALPARPELGASSRRPSGTSTSRERRYSPSPFACGSGGSTRRRPPRAARGRPRSRPAGRAAGGPRSAGRPPRGAAAGRPPRSRPPRAATGSGTGRGPTARRSRRRPCRRSGRRRAVRAAARRCADRPLTSPVAAPAGRGTGAAAAGARTSTGGASSSGTPWWTPVCVIGTRSPSGRTATSSTAAAGTSVGQ
jgi:hypothetical protein